MEESLLSPRADRAPDVYEKITGLLKATPYGLTLAQLLQGVDAKETIVKNAVRDMERVNLIVKVERDGEPALRRLRRGR